MSRTPARDRGGFAGNVAARLGALASLSVATVIVARIGGPAAVGTFALLRVLLGLTGVLISGGLPGVCPYFLSGPDREDRRVPATVAAIAAGAGLAGVVAWIGCAPLLGHTLLRGVPQTLVALAGAGVLTKLQVATAKACLQGRGDLRAANGVIVGEELAFIPVYLAVAALHAGGLRGVVLALVLADVLVGIGGWARLASRGFLEGARPPGRDLVRAIWRYGTRGQIGGLLTLVNLRLDFAMLGALAGPAVLGGYAVASKYAELMRVAPLAVTYVLYPRFAADSVAGATDRARRLLPRSGTAVAACALPLGLAAPTLLPALFGAAFRDAVVPAEIILAGLVLEGVSGVITAHLYGTGRPGLNSLAMGAGVTVTLVLDLLLIPRMGSVGAACASTTAYLVTAAVLLICFASVSGSTVSSARTPAAAVREPS